MGNKPRKISCGAPSQANQRAENDGDPVSPSASKSSPSKVPAPVQVHCTEVLIVHISPKENEVYILVPPEEMEEARPQENFEKSSEMSSIAMTSGSSEVASGISEEDNAAPELASSTTETSVKTDVQPTGLDLLREACQVLLPETAPTPPPKTYETSSSAEHTSDSSAVSEEEAATELVSVGTLSVGVAEPQEGTKDLHPSSELSEGTEVPESGQKVSGEVEPELSTDNVQGAAEKQATGQKELDEVTPEEALQGTAEPHPNLVLTETPDRPSINMAALVDEQLAEGQTDPQDHRPLSVSETEGEIPEECSAGGSWKEREGLRSPKEVSTEAELQPNDQKVPCGTCLELTTEHTQVAAEEPTTLQRRLDEDASPEKSVDIESHLDSALVETSGGTPDMGATPGTKQLAEEQSVPGHDLPPAATEMEGKVGDFSGAENTGQMTKALNSQLKIPPTEAQDKTLAQVETGDETACPIAPNTPQEKELEHTLTQRLSTAEERPDSDVQLHGDAEVLDAAQLGEAGPAVEAAVPEAGPAVEAAVPEAGPAVQAQPPAEVTMPQSSLKAPLGAAETTKELEEASPDPPLAEETTEQAGSPEAQLPPVPGTPLGVEREEEDAEFVDATDTCKAAEVPAWDGVLEAQDKHNGKDELMRESPVGSPKLIPEEEARGDTPVRSNADFPEASKVEDSSPQHSGPEHGCGPSTLCT